MRLQYLALASLVLFGSACRTKSIDSRQDNSQLSSQGNGPSVQNKTNPQNSSVPKVVECGKFAATSQFYVGRKLIAKGFNLYDFKTNQVIGSAYFDAVSGIVDAFEKKNNLSGKTVVLFDANKQVIAKARISILTGAQNYKIYDCKNTLIGSVNVSLASSLLSALGGGSPNISGYNIYDAQKQELARSTKLDFGITSFLVGDVKIFDTLLGWQVNMNDSKLDPRIVTFIPIMKSLSMSK